MKKGLFMQIKGKRVFITGGAGFIGSSLAKRLAEKNQVVIYDNLHRNALKNTMLKDHPNIKFIKGDVMDEKNVAKAIKDSNIVVHLAAIAGVDTVLSMPTKTMEVAIIGTYNVLKAAAALKSVERFIDFSTSEVFGRFAYQAKETEATTLGTVGEARWTYAVSKLATEHLALNYYKEKGLPTVAIRPFNIYGPNQVGVGAVHQFIKRALKNETIQIHNDGSQIRAWCYIDDIIDGIMLCLKKKQSIGNTFNIGNPKSTVTIYNLAQEIIRLSSSQSVLEYVERDMQDVELRVPDIAKARNLLGYEPKVDLEEGLLRTIYWYRNM